MKADAAGAAACSARHGTDQARHVLPHAEALVANPVALAEVLSAAGAGKRDRTEHEREAELERHVADADEPAGQRPPRVGGDRERHAERHDDAHGGDLDEDQPLERHVDDRRQRQRRTDDEQRAHGDVARVAAEDVTRQRRGAQHPARPQVREVHHDRQHEPPVLPEPVEPRQRRLARGERVALDFHVQEELRHDAEHRAPEKDEASLRGNERPEDELARRQADAGGNDAGADDAPEITGRIRKVADDEGLEGHRVGVQGSVQGSRFRGSRFRVRDSDCRRSVKAA